MLGESSNPQADSNGCVGCGCIMLAILVVIIVIMMLLDNVGRALLIGIVIGWFVGTLFK